MVGDANKADPPAGCKVQLGGQRDVFSMDGGAVGGTCVAYAGESVAETSTGGVKTEGGRCLRKRDRKERKAYKGRVWRRRLGGVEVPRTSSRRKGEGKVVM